MKKSFRQSSLKSMHIRPTLALWAGMSSFYAQPNCQSTVELGIGEKDT